MPKASRYAVGERWFCDRTVASNPYDRPPFVFVIMGPSKRKGYKLCDLQFVDGSPAYPNAREGYHEYSHEHLKKYAVHWPHGTPLPEIRKPKQ